MSGLTPLRAIRAKCIDCSGGSRIEVRQCTVRDCPMWPYRHGHRPRIGSDEEKVHVAMGKLSLRELGDCRATRRTLEAESGT